MLVEFKKDEISTALDNFISIWFVGAEKDKPRNVFQHYQSYPMDDYIHHSKAYYRLMKIKKLKNGFK